MHEGLGQAALNVLNSPKALAVNTIDFWKNISSFRFCRPGLSLPNILDFDILSNFAGLDRLAEGNDREGLSGE